MKTASARSRGLRFRKNPSKTSWMSWLFESEKRYSTRFSTQCFLTFDFRAPLRLTRTLKILRICSTLMCCQRIPESSMSFANGLKWKEFLLLYSLEVSFSVAEFPQKVCIYSTLIGLLNTRNYGFGGEVSSYIIFSFNSYRLLFAGRGETYNWFPKLFETRRIWKGAYPSSLLRRFGQHSSNIEYFVDKSFRESRGCHHGRQYSSSSIRLFRLLGSVCIALGWQRIVWEKRTRIGSNLEHHR